MVLLVTPTAVELSVWMGDCPWGYLISMRVWRRGITSLEVTNRAASSASAAEDLKDLNIWAMVRMGTLYPGLGYSSERKMCASAWMRALGTLIYAASEWTARRMLLAL